MLKLKLFKNIKTAKYCVKSLSLINWLRIGDWELLE